jgi:NADH-quinone oxidoreductase subunit C
MWFDDLKDGFSRIARREDASLYLMETDREATGTDLEATVPGELVATAAQVMYETMYTLECITGIDRITEGQMELVYDYVHFQTGRRVTVRTFVPRQTPELATISAIFPGGEWHEREARDFFGFIFTGHPDPKPLLLPEDADFHPLRKDFA